MQHRAHRVWRIPSRKARNRSGCLNHRDGTAKCSQNVLAELSRLALECSPTLSTARGDLYPADNVPLAAIHLNVSRTDYLAYLASLPSIYGTSPSARLIVPVDNLPFDIVVNRGS